MGDSDEYDYEYSLFFQSLCDGEMLRCISFSKLYTNVVGVHLQLIGCIIWMLLIWMVLQNHINMIGLHASLEN
jgi:hypothetical protein